MAFWPALLLARERRLPWALRGLLAGSARAARRGRAAEPEPRLAVRDAGHRACSCSRCCPAARGRSRCSSPVAAGVGRGRAGGASRGRSPARRRSRALARAHGDHGRRSLAALVVALVVAGGAALEARRAGHAPGPPGCCTGSRPLRRSSRWWRWSPAGWPRRATRSRALKKPGTASRADTASAAATGWSAASAATATTSSVSRSTNSRAHPVGGIGADNFQQQYLRHGHSGETPRYPHSVELRTLSQTGVIGTLLALMGLGAALLAAMRAAALARPLAARCRRRGAGGLRLLGDPWLGRLVLGVRRARGAGVRDARPRVRAYAARANLRATVRCDGQDGRARWATRGRRRTDAVSAGRRHGPVADREPAEPATAGAARPADRGERAWGCSCSLARCAGRCSAPWLSGLEVEQAARIWTRSPRTATPVWTTPRG